eukprot:249869-Prymnesium_polylepis.2
MTLIANLPGPPHHQQPRLQRRTKKCNCRPSLQRSVEGAVRKLSADHSRAQMGSSRFAREWLHPPVPSVLWSGSRGWHGRRRCRAALSC